MVSKESQVFWELLKDIVLMMKHIMWFSAAEAKLSTSYGDT